MPADVACHLSAGLETSAITWRSSPIIAVICYLLQALCTRWGVVLWSLQLDAAFVLFLTGEINAWDTAEDCDA